MKLKLDENLGSRCRQLLADAGHDVATVVEQSMVSATDRDLIEACRAEKRALITLDLDFSNPLIFRPSDCAGIAVLRLPRHPAFDDLVLAVRTLIGALNAENIAGKLWSVERGRVRIYQQPDDDQ